MAFGDLSLVIEHASGGTTRLAWDEVDAEGNPQGLQFGSTSQGGPSTLSTSLLRVLGDPGPFRLFDPVKVLNDSGLPIWEGRLAQAARAVSGDVTTIAISAEGWAGALGDRKDARFLGIDRDPAAWRTDTLQRTANVITSAFRPTDFTQKQGAIGLSISGYAWSSNPGRPIAEATYDAGPLRIGRVFGTWKSTGTVDISADVNWNLEVVDASDSDLSADVTVSGNLNPGTGGVGELGFSKTVASKKVVALQMAYGIAPAGADAVTWEASFLMPAVVGDHGIALTDDGNGTMGLLVSDCIPYWLAQFAPTIAPGSIPSTGVPIPDFKFTAQTKPIDMVTTGLSYHGWNWGIWHDQKLDIAPWGSGTSWQIRAKDEGVQLSDDGAQAVDTYNALVVNYSQAGVDYCVGPAGTLADFHDDRLRSSDPGNAAVRAGEWRVDTFDIPGYCTQQLATTLGQVLLADREQAVRSGSAQITGAVQADGGQMFPVSEIKATDDVTVLDDDLTPRRAVEVAYDHSTRTATVTFDNGLQSTDALLAHLQARVVGV